MENIIKIRKIRCKTIIGKCGFPGGGLSINPYVGCGHACVYCYARFMKRFTGHAEPWGTFVDARVNSAEVLEKQLRSGKYKGCQIYIGTVTDPYQPLEKELRITRSILEVLKNHENPVSILTKSNLILRDIDLLKQMSGVDVDITLNSLDENWRSLVEPHSSTVRERLDAMKTLSGKGIGVYALMGPYWPFFTDAAGLFEEFSKAGLKGAFTESFNTTGGNWEGVKKILAKHYPELLPKMEEIFFDEKKFYEFYSRELEKITKLSKKHNLPITIRFGLGHQTQLKPQKSDKK